MDMEPVSAFLGILMRWMHIAGAVILLGAMIFARYVVYPSGSDSDALWRRFGGWLTFAVAGLLGSGIYNLLTKAAYPPGYHMWFGIKFLLALHVMAIGFLLARAKADSAKRARWLSGAVLTGALILAISAYLRWISQHV
jgi:putative copper export protein